MSVTAARGLSRRIRLAFSIGLALAAPGAVSLAFADTITAPGLTAPGKITYDAAGMPTIQAASDNDAAFLMGYAHARYRFFQMDLTRRSVSGTLAALVGPSQLSNDVQARTLGLRRAADKTWLALSDDMRGWLTAYANGVNFWLKNNPLPPEYGALDLTQADPWTPVDSICVGKGLAFQLSFDLDISATIQLGAYQASGKAAGYDGTALFFGDVVRTAPPDNRVSVPGFQPGAAASLQAGTQSSAEHVAPVASAGVQSIGTIDPTTIKLAQNYRDAVSD